MILIRDPKVVSQFSYYFSFWTQSFKKLFWGQSNLLRSCVTVYAIQNSKVWSILKAIFDVYKAWRSCKPICSLKLMKNVSFSPQKGKRWAEPQKQPKMAFQHCNMLQTFLKGFNFPLPCFSPKKPQKCHLSFKPSRISAGN